MLHIVLHILTFDVLYRSHLLGNSNQIRSCKRISPGLKQAIYKEWKEKELQKAKRQKVMQQTLEVQAEAAQAAGLIDTPSPQNQALVSGGSGMFHVYFLYCSVSIVITNVVSCRLGFQHPQDWALCSHRSQAVDYAYHDAQAGHRGAGQANGQVLL